MAAIPETLLLAAPRGYCAGVDRAVQTVERALELYGAPVYVRKEIVHNKHVVEQLRERGAVFVESETEVPPGRHGRLLRPRRRPGGARRTRERRGLHTIDATCPLVTKVHREADKFAAEGYTIVLIGHAGHEEVEGTMGEAPDHIVLIEDEAGRRPLRSAIPTKVAYISQTTLSVDETRAIINRLRERFPAIVGPRTDDICYATTNRQAAVKQLAQQSDLVLVIGSRNSSNSNRLVEVAREHGADSLPDRQREPGARGVARRQADRRDHLRARARPRSSSSAWWRSSARAAPSTSVSWRSCPRTSASCFPRRFARRSAAPDPATVAPGTAHLTTLVISDLHLGARARRDLFCAAPTRGPRCVAALAGVERLVLLGDVVELRQGSARRGPARLRDGRCRRSAPRSGPARGS